MEERVGWVECSLSDIAVVLPGFGFPKILQGKTKGKYPFYKVGDISKNVQAGNEVLRFCDNYIDDEELNKIKGELLAANTIVFAKIGEALKLNRRAIINQPSLIDNNAVGVYALPGVLEFLFLYYFFLRVRLENYSRATTVPSVRKSDIEKICFLLPPLPEQRAIVAKIELLFSELDDGIASLKKAQAQLKIYRQAVLKKAFEGALTEEWREKQADLPNAQDLLEEIKKERETSAKSEGKKTKPIKALAEMELAGLPKKWAWVRLGDVTLKADKVNIKRKKMEEEFKYLDIGGINNQTYKIESYKVYNWEEAPSRAQQIVLKGDTLFSTVRTYLKNIAKVDKDELSGEICSSGFTVIRGIEKYIDSSFIFYLTLYEGFLQPLNELQTGTSYPAVRDTDVFLQPFPLCSLEEQRQIVQEIETRLSVCDNIEAIIKEALLKAKALRQSILKKAFEGRLLDDQELEKARRAPDWEPAEKLLERIRAEKGNARFSRTKQN